MNAEGRSGGGLKGRQKCSLMIADGGWKEGPKGDRKEGKNAA